MRKERGIVATASVLERNILPQVVSGLGEVGEAAEVVLA